MIRLKVQGHTYVKVCGLHFLLVAKGAAFALYWIRKYRKHGTIRRDRRWKYREIAANCRKRDAEAVRCCLFLMKNN